MSVARRSIALLLAGTWISVFAQRAEDTALFSITLTDDSTSLYYCKWGVPMSRMLAGPVCMADNQLLFFSQDGYVLYDQNGALVDSQSLAAENKGIGRADPGRLVLAQPTDPSTILYFRKTPYKTNPCTIYQKKLAKKRIKAIDDEEYARYNRYAEGRVFNLAHNAITDEMASKVFLRPQLVGFAMAKPEEQWWSLDRFYTFSSPLVNERGRSGYELFPGVKSRVDASAEIKRQLAEPLAVFVRDGKRYYVGVYAAMGTTENEYSQMIYTCDNAGNILYCDTILKQANTDVILGEDVNEKMYYTARQTARYVFQPSVSFSGTIFYGIADYQAKSICVRKREYFTYKPQKTQPDLAHLIDLEKGVSYKPVVITCGAAQQGGKTIPDMTVTDDKGGRRKATTIDLTKGDYIVRIYRQEYRDLSAKLGGRRSALPPEVVALRDSLNNLSTTSCPYGVSLNGPHGVLESFDYAPGENVLCARVLAVTRNGMVVVRVDCDTYAEIVLFSADGRFVNRFTFNRQRYDKRKDIVVASETGPIIEMDYEEHGGGSFFAWTPVAGE
jgi:hypothetical protein